MQVTSFLKEHQVVLKKYKVETLVLLGILTAISALSCLGSFVSGCQCSRGL